MQVIYLRCLIEQRHLEINFPSFSVDCYVMQDIVMFVSIWLPDIYSCSISVNSFILGIVLCFSILWEPKGWTFKRKYSPPNQLRCLSFSLSVCYHRNEIVTQQLAASWLNSYGLNNFAKEREYHWFDPDVALFDPDFEPWV